jgi:ketosteroid isomerase-like protein
MASARATLERLYDAFARCDGATMASCYAPDAHFADPVYPDLNGAEVGAMWRMLTGRAQDLTIEVRALTADEHTGSATWLARYEFGPARRHVANLVHSSFVFADGLIQDERDEFDFHGWAAMALGPKGRFLGWTPMVHSAVRKQADQGLREFIAAQ